MEPNAELSGHTTGGTLIVDGKYEFSDLDELIVNHVQALARRVEELMAYEKFKPDSFDIIICSERRGHWEAGLSLEEALMRAER